MRKPEEHREARLFSWSRLHSASRGWPLVYKVGVEIFALQCYLENYETLYKKYLKQNTFFQYIGIYFNNEIYRILLNLL